MHNNPENDVFLGHNLKLHKMIDMHSKYDNMHTNRIFNVLNCINNYVNSCINCMLSTIHDGAYQKISNPNPHTNPIFHVNDSPSNARLVTISILPLILPPQQTRRPNNAKFGLKPLLFLLVA